jgi:5-formyltetrahydrofolate cyclo-ligase
MSVGPGKALIRQEILARRKAFAGTGEERAASLLVQSVLLAALPPSGGKSVGLYVPLRGEVDTDELWCAWEGAGASVYYPRADGAGGLRFYPRPEQGGWIRGPHGVPEPPFQPGREAERFDLLVVPGVAFDRAGTRLGRGAGCYDRFLSSIPRPGALFGLAWSWQLVDELPAERWDVPVDAVVTEKGVVPAERVTAAASPHST